MLRRPALEALSIGQGDRSGGSSEANSPLSNGSPVMLSESGKFVIGAFEISREGVAAKPQTRSALGSEVSAPEGGEVAAAAAVFAELQPLEIIGRGASGFVRRAVHTTSDSVVAIKEICISDPARRRQIMNEIALLRAQNPNEVRHLVQYRGVRYLEGSIQIAMEYMDAGSLGDLLQRIGPLSQECMCARIDSI